MTAAPDVLARLRSADSVDRASPPSREERDHAERTLAAILAEPALPAARPRPVVRRLALAGPALAATIAVVVVALSGGSGVAPARAAFVALSARDGVFHAVERVTVHVAGRRPTHSWVESWAAARGGRVHELRYDAAPDGRRGRLVAEGIGETTKIFVVPRDRGVVGVGGLGHEPHGDPREAYLDAYRDGRVRFTGTVRGAWRFIATERAPASPISFQGRPPHTVPAHRVVSVFLVDPHTGDLLFVRRTGLVGTETGFERDTTTQRYVRFERLSDRAGRAGLLPTPRFEHPDRPRPGR